MIKVSILFAPDSTENRKAVEEIASALDAAHCAVTLKKAAESIISDVTGADVILFGVQKTDSSEVQEEFREFARIFKGINLAGKTAAFFTFSQDKAASALRKCLKSSDISLADPEITLAEKSPSRQSDIKEWVRQVLAFHQEGRNAGK
jgi:flavodoxin